MPVPQVELVVRRPGQPERRMLLGQGVTSLGRAEDNDLVLPDIGVSRRHARLVVNSDQVYVEDLGSGNGTFFAGTRVDRKVLGDGDEVVIDPFVLSFRFRGASGADEVPPELGGAGLCETGGAVRLMVLSGHRLAASYPLGSAPLSMGRAEGRDIVLYDPAASRDHARVELREGRYWYVDRGSANGSFVNGQRVREQPLLQGDRIRIGTTEFRFETMGSDEVPGSAPDPTPYVGSTRSQVAFAQPTQSRSALGAEPTPEPIYVPPVQPPRPEAFPETVPVLAIRPYDPDQATVARPAPVGPGLAVRMLQLGAVIVLLTVLAFTVVAVGVGGWYIWARQQATAVAEVEPARPGSGAAPTGASAPAANTPAPAAHQVSPEHAAEVDKLMSEGMLAFYEGRYLDSAARFYKVLKLEPGYGEAEHMGFVACEYIAFDALREDALVRATSDTEKRRRYRDSLALADRALGGKASLGAARTELEDVLAFYPDDADVSTALSKVRRAIAKAADTDEARRHVKTVKVLHDKAVADRAAGRIAEATESFEGVVAADPEKLTWYAYDATATIGELKAEMKQAARATVSSAKDAIRRKDWPEAKRLLEEAVRIDPYDEETRKLLAEVAKKVDG